MERDLSKKKCHCPFREKISNGLKIKFNRKPLNLTNIFSYIPKKSTLVINLHQTSPNQNYQVNINQSSDMASTKTNQPEQNINLHQNHN